MSAIAFSQFLRRLGHRVVEGPSGAWYDASRFFLLGIPGHELRRPGDDEIRQLLRQWPTFGLRFTTPLDGVGKLSYQIVCDDSQYRLESLSANTRSKIRRGLRRCEIRQAAPAEVAVAGRRAHDDTLARQGRSGVLTGERWDRFWEAAAETPEMEVWTAWVEGELAAFVVTVLFGDCIEYMLARSRTDSLGAYPNNALLFTMTEEMLCRRRLREVTFGLESLEPVAPLDQFKFSLGFRTKPLRQRVVFHPAIAAALRPQPVRALCHRWGAQAKGQGVFWRKAAGLLRFAEEAGL